MALIPMALSRIMISETQDHQYIVLKEKGGERQFPIVIGIFEAAAIDRRVKEKRPPRPLTHDLLWNLIGALGGTLERIVVNSLKDNTFFARLVIRVGGADGAGRTIEVDARPSDAVALSVQGDTPVPIFVDEKVLEEATKL